MVVIRLVLCYPQIHIQAHQTLSAFIFNNCKTCGLQISLGHWLSKCDVEREPMFLSLSSKVYICARDFRTTGLSMNNSHSDDLRLECQLCPVWTFLLPGSRSTPWYFCSHNKAHHATEKSVITPWLKYFPCSSAMLYISSCLPVLCSNYYYSWF